MTSLQVPDTGVQGCPDTSLLGLQALPLLLGPCGPPHPLPFCTHVNPLHPSMSISSLATPRQRSCPLSEWDCPELPVKSKNSCQKPTSRTAPRLLPLAPSAAGISGSCWPLAAPAGLAWCLAQSGCSARVYPVVFKRLGASIHTPPPCLRPRRTNG